MSITLPPLPERNPRSYKWTEREKQEIRARDREVARVVLKAAADLVDGNAAYCSGQTAAILGANADAIRKMEVRHHE